MGLTRHEDELSEGILDDTRLWHLRNRLLEAIEQSSKNSGWIEIENPATAEAIVSIYGNSWNRKILNICIRQPHTIMEILRFAQTPQTTGYRRIISLVKGNFLFGYNTVRRTHGKTITRYLATFKAIEFQISENKELIRVKLQDNLYKKDQVRDRLLFHTEPVHKLQKGLTV